MTMCNSLLLMQTTMAEHELGARSAEFAQQNGEYYARAFAHIQNAAAGQRVWSWNSAAALGGALWAAWRRMGGFFWLLALLELTALVQIGKGVWGHTGGELVVRHQQVLTSIAARQQQLQAIDNPASRETAERVIANLTQVAQRLEQLLAQESNTKSLYVGLLLFLLVKIFSGFSANIIYQKKYRRWRIRSSAKTSGCSWRSCVAGLLLLLAIYPLTIFRFTVAEPDKVLAGWSGGLLGEKITITTFPIGRELFNQAARWGDSGFNWATKEFSHLFAGISHAIVVLLDALEVVMLETPWAVIMLVLVVLALRLAGARVAIFTAASLAYLALLGLWEAAMITVALIGAGAGVSIIFGIPIGIWFGRNARVYRVAEPVLDFMQTMPTFVYLIPIIAFFGTGKPPSVLVTIIFAIPPVIRLTALGIRNVSAQTQEAAIAFGCSSWQLLWKVQLPLAKPSIMAGINQTILMSLSMVVIASLIGADGLGALILEALQYAAKGQGLLAGVAILLCAMVMDRIAQGSMKRKV